jgi:23S rRNA pseudouridine2605 synthase
LNGSIAGAIRLQKYLSRAGAASRRRAEKLIRAGRVLVNGRVVVELGTRVDPAVDRVTLDGRAVELGPALWVALNKPRGFVTTRSDPQGRPTIYDLLPPRLRGLFHVGRLDVDSEGLILLTNDGERAHRLLHPRFRVSRVYDVLVHGVPSDATLARLVQGIELDDGVARARSALRLGASDGRGRIRIQMAEGRKREVRRMLGAVGHRVLRLRRRSYGPVGLKGVKTGQWRELAPGEVTELARRVGDRSQP